MTQVGGGAGRDTAATARPVVAGLALAALAVAEAVVRVERPGERLSVALLLGLAATLPVAVARTHLAASAIVVTAATAALVVDDELLTAAVAGQLAVAGALIVRGVETVRRRGAAAADRAATERAIAETLLENAARSERARIVRELHDVVAHHVSMIAVQAEAARLTTPGLPPEGAKRLLAIGDTARTALTEMRRLLGVLREDAGDGGADRRPTRAPQPGLDRLNELIDEARATGSASTRLIVRGCVAPLGPGVELVAFRIVQEALTNARRHAPGAAVDVELEYAPDALHLQVRDNGPGPGGHPGEDPVPGHGLLGMRERVATLGGTLHTGPAPGAGFLVRARLPAAEDAP